MKKNFLKTLIIVFEVIVKPHKTHFSTFAKVQKQKKSETKIMKITHSAQEAAAADYFCGWLHTPFVGSIKVVVVAAAAEVALI